VGGYLVSRLADIDLETIAEASLEEWGQQRTEAYIRSLNDTFQRIVMFPDIGKRAAFIRPGLMQLPCGRHTIFYMKAVSGIIIVRVLHERMDFSRHH
jgi:toxin ParE1/3/4